MKKILISCFLFVSLFTFSSVDIKYDNFDFYINQNIDNQLNSIEADTVSLIQENSQTQETIINTKIRLFIISKDNYKIMLKDRNINKYWSYFNQIYVLN